MLAFVATAGQVRVAWSPSPDDRGTNLTYVLYAASAPLVKTNLHAAPVRLNVGTNLTAGVLFTNSGRWYLRVTALDVSGVESEPSNEVAVEVPAPPRDARTLALQYTFDLATTNGWQTAGSLFLRLQP